MKWFIAVNEVTLTHPEHDIPGLIQASVASALQNTSLQPHLIYDGGENDLIARLRAMNVTIVPHRVSFYDEIMRTSAPGFNPLIAGGAYLRTEIPSLGLPDKYVLYTDCDVIFLRQPTFLELSPDYFASAPETHFGDYNDLNTGVMLMNLHQLGADWPEFRKFIVANLANFNAYDQGAYREYYRDRYDLLPPEANWKPYWGVNDAAEIVHYHGPKPESARKLLANPGYEMPAAWRPLFDKDPGGYRHYVAIWDECRQRADPAVRTGP